MVKLSKKKKTFAGKKPSNRHDADGGGPDSQRVTSKENDCIAQVKKKKTIKAKERGEKGTNWRPTW